MFDIADLNSAVVTTGVGEAEASGLGSSDSEIDSFVVDVLEVPEFVEDEPDPPMAPIRLMIIRTITI
jgi:hypothetical protein